MPVVVSFVGHKGGVGKSTLARALAAVAARGNLRVRRADLDAQQQTSARWQIPVTRTESLFRSTRKRSTRSKMHSDAVRGLISSLSIRPAMRALRRSISLGLHMWSFCRRERVGRPLPDSAAPLRAGMDGIPKDELAIASAALELCEEHGARKYVEAAGYEALQGCIPERIGYRRAQNRGQSLTEMSQVSLKEARTRMESLLEKVLSQLKASKSFERQKRKRQNLVRAQGAHLSCSGTLQ